MLDHTVANAESSRAPSFRDLPFIANGKWHSGATGNYAADCELGHAHARLLLEAMREAEQSTMYGAVMRCITLSGQTGGVEIGFYQGIAEALL